MGYAVTCPIHLTFQTFVHSIYRLEHWDVNNEMLSNSWYKDTYGSSSIRNDMFSMVRKNDPNVKLFLNDYNIINGGQRLVVSLV